MFQINIDGNFQFAIILCKFFFLFFRFVRLFPFLFCKYKSFIVYFFFNIMQWFCPKILAWIDSCVDLKHWNWNHSCSNAMACVQQVEIHGNCGSLNINTVAGDVITIKYTKDGSQSTGNDNASVTILTDITQVDARITVACLQNHLLAWCKHESHHNTSYLAQSETTKRMSSVSMILQPAISGCPFMITSYNSYHFLINWFARYCASLM